VHPQQQVRPLITVLIGSFVYCIVCVPFGATSWVRSFFNPCVGLRGRPQLFPRRGAAAAGCNQCGLLLRGCGPRGEAGPRLAGTGLKKRQMDANDVIVRLSLSACLVESEDLGWAAIPSGGPLNLTNVV
jgi:hypothetical protein